jgi:hypothetical protein
MGLVRFYEVPPTPRARAPRDPPMPWESGALASARSAGIG